ncbi:hypothetical protein L1049_019678 [Liquidambar formosana]|uniref:Protein kinase domain-containing protein n=1 Tax=Liquidambar formosana TaxID=63359 RepID=A0AAP0X359_LIQFO
MERMVDSKKNKKYEPIGSIEASDLDKILVCRDVTTNEIVIVRRITSIEESIPSSVEEKTAEMKRLNNKNIVRLLDVVVHEYKMELVYEDVGPNLKQFIDSYPEKMKDPLAIKRLLYQMLCGVAYCHSHGIVYGNLNPKNILIDVDNFQVKLAYAGLAGLARLAKAVDVALDSLRYYIETRHVKDLWYMAPEILQNLPETSSVVDMWSVGCIFAEMVKGKPLVQRNTELAQLLSFISILGTPSEEIMSSASRWKITYPKDLAEEFPTLEQAGIDLLSKMLCWAPSQRITACSALKHSYFNDVVTKKRRTGVLSGKGLLESTSSELQLCLGQGLQ